MAARRRNGSKEGKVRTTHQKTKQKKTKKNKQTKKQNSTITNILFLVDLNFDFKTYHFYIDYSIFLLYAIIFLEKPNK